FETSRSCSWILPSALNMLLVVSASRSFSLMTCSPLNNSTFTMSANTSLRASRFFLLYPSLP
ncbi:MAG: hypothetical protein U0K92_02220, partial [Treponema sp.]|nr:hypothetical protein [Treponema sp.]